MRTFVCMRKTYVLGKVWNRNESDTGEKLPNRHFAWKGEEEKWLSRAPDRRQLEADAMKVKKGEIIVDGKKLDPEEMNEDQLRKTLDAAGIKYHPNAKKEALVFKLHQMKER